MIATKTGCQLVFWKADATNKKVYETKKGKEFSGLSKFYD